MLSLIMLFTAITFGKMNSSAETFWNEGLTVVYQTSDVMKPGADVTLTLQITNSTETSMTTTRFNHNVGCLDESFGQIMLNGVEISGVELTIPAGETVNVTMTGKIPTDAGSNDDVYTFISAMGEDGNTYNATAFKDVEDDTQLLQCPEIHSDTRGILQAGMPAEFSVIICNPTNKRYDISSISVNNVLENSVITDDFTGNVYDGSSIIQLHAGETLCLTISGTVAATALETDEINFTCSGHMSNGSLGSINDSNTISSFNSYNSFRFYGYGYPHVVHLGEEVTFEIWILANEKITIDDYGCQYFADSSALHDVSKVIDLDCTMTDENGNHIVNNDIISPGETGEIKTYYLSFVFPRDWSETGSLNIWIQGTGETSGTKVDNIFEDYESLIDLISTEESTEEPTEEPTVSEVIEKKEDVPAISLPDSKDNTLADAIFSEEEIENASTLEAKLVANKVEEKNVDKELIEKIKEKAGEKQIAVILDLSVEKIIDGINNGKVSKLNNKISITIDIPKEYLANGRVFSIIKEHEGTITELKDLDSNPNTITFETDEFSLYTLVYTNDTSASDVTPSDPIKNVVENESTKASNVTESDTPKTGDYADLRIAFVLMMVAGIAIVIIKKRSNQYK